MPDDFSDIYGDPSPQEQVAAQVAALRRQQTLGVLGQLSGDKVMGGAGASLVQNAQHGQQMMQQAQDRSLMRAIQARREQDMAEHYGNEDDTRALLAGRHRAVKAGNGETLDYDPIAATATTLRAAPPPKPAGLGKGGTGQPQSVDDATLNMLADQFAATGKTSVSNRSPLFQAVVQRMAQRHPDANLGMAGAAYHANASSLHEAQKQSDAMDRNEAKAGADLDILEDALGKLNLYDNRLLNKPILALKQNTSPEVSAFMTAHRAAVAQVSKVLNGSAGPVTDSVRHEAEELLREDLTPAQFHAGMTVLRQDMARNKAAMHDSVATIGQRISGKTPQANVAPSSGVHTPEEIAAAKKWLSDPKNGTPEQRAKVQAIVGGL